MVYGGPLVSRLALCPVCVRVAGCFSGNLNVLDVSWKLHIFLLWEPELVWVYLVLMAYADSSARWPN